MPCRSPALPNFELQDQIQGCPSNKASPRAVKTLDNVEGYWVKKQKIVVEDGEIAEYRVDLKVTFVLTE